jgi:hypothetical protein
MVLWADKWVSRLPKVLAYYQRVCGPPVVRQVLSEDDDRS